MQDDYGNAIGNAKTINERLQMLGASMDEVRGSLRAGDERMTRIEDNASTLREELASNTQATKQVADNTRELVDLFESFKGAFRVLNWLGKLAKPMAYIVGLGASLVGLWTAMRGHR